MSTKKKLLEAAAGNAGGATYVEDVFSTDLYIGSNTNETITNGIDLDGEGGLVWLKHRTNAASYYGHQLTDTVRGKTYNLQTDLTSAEGSLSILSSFNSNGYTVGSAISNTGTPIVGWTFRKQPGFFDVVTYTGNGTNQTISHNLGSVPGMIVVKRRDSSTNGGWVTYHRSTSASPQNDYMVLQTNQGVNQWTDWNQTAPTSTEFSVGSVYTNTSGATYVAYLFAHDAQDFGTDSDESIIKCGGYTGNGSATGVEVDLGFEPQWLLIKTASGSGTHKNWWLLDNMRGIITSANDPVIAVNLSDSEATTAQLCELTGTGFIPKNGSQANQNGMNYIYVAIRRPHKPAEEFAATDLFDVEFGSNTAEPWFKSGFATDMAFIKNSTSTGNWAISSRLTQGKDMATNLTDAESPNASAMFDYQNGYYANFGASTSWLGWMFRRAPGFFDVVAYTGTGSTLVLDHNLGVEPEFMIVKGRTINAGWHCYHKDVGNTKAVPLNSSGAESTSSFYWNNTSPTATQATLGAFTHYNVSNQTGILYLFATVPGISKVGSYSGTGSNVDVNCGFTSGARFVLVKRTDSTGDWYVWDSERGIVAGNDPYLLLNSTAAQVTSTDYIDPLSSGFTVTSSAPSALNASGGTYLFLAIA